MAPVLRSRAHSEQLASGSTDTQTFNTQTLDAQRAPSSPTMTRRTAHDLRESGFASEGYPLPPVSSPELAELMEEERRIDEQLAIARRTESLRAKRAELAQLQRGSIIVPATPPEPRAPEDRVAPPGLVPGPDVRPPTTGPCSCTHHHGHCPAQLPPRADAASVWRAPAPKLPSYKGQSSTALRNFLFDCRSNFTLLGVTGSFERVAYATGCLDGIPKRAWVKYINDQEADPTFDHRAVTWAEFVDFLETSLSDPGTRALDAASKLELLSQSTTETVPEFVDRYTTILADLPYALPDAQRVVNLLTKLRKEIGSTISCQTTLPATFTQLVSTARRVEDSQRIGGTSAYREPDASPRSQPAQPPRQSPARAPANPYARRCYGCGKEGHIRPDCPEARTPAPAVDSPPAGTPLPAPAAHRELIRCFNCNQVGHYASSCPEAVCRRCGQKGHSAVKCHITTPNNQDLGRERGVGAAS